MIPVDADVVTRAEFDELLAQYPAMLKSISSSKGAKQGQKSLEELDVYRYEEAPRRFAGNEPDREMDLDAIKALVEWKLRHGKFRPTLMNLVSSNGPKLASDTVREALGMYRADGTVAPALGILTRLKGIGPATASLLLTVHDPTRVIFFSDEAFYWLCCSGKKAPIKYNAKEYQALCSRAQDLSKKLDVSATDIEKVAYVLMKQSGNTETSNKPATKSIVRGASAKRKIASDPEPAPKQPPVRRSKRTKA